MDKPGAAGRGVRRVALCTIRCSEALVAASGSGSGDAQRGSAAVRGSSGAVGLHALGWARCGSEGYEAWRCSTKMELTQGVGR